MVRNDHRNWIHPAIILTFIPMMGCFLTYIINKRKVDAWIRVTFEGDWLWLSSSVLIAVAAIAFIMCTDLFRP